MSGRESDRRRGQRKDAVELVQRRSWCRERQANTHPPFQRRELALRLEGSGWIERSSWVARKRPSRLAALPGFPVRQIRRRVQSRRVISYGLFAPAILELFFGSCPPCRDIAVVVGATYTGAARRFLSFRWPRNPKKWKVRRRDDVELADGSREAKLGHFGYVLQHHSDLRTPSTVGPIMVESRPAESHPNILVVTLSHPVVPWTIFTVLSS